MTDRYAAFKSLKFDRPSDRVLRITLDRAESMNSLNWCCRSQIVPTRIADRANGEPS